MSSTRADCRRHVGDGVIAFFPAETFDSESAAALACITAAHNLREAMRDVASRSDLTPDDVVMRFGLHWGSTLYMGHITTVARAEVTALGDEVNEAARIEACATGGLILASKPLIERLDTADATRGGLDPDHTTYTQLGELTTGTDKAAAMHLPLQSASSEQPSDNGSSPDTGPTAVPDTRGAATASDPSWIRQYAQTPTMGHSLGSGAPEAEARRATNPKVTGRSPRR